jgi:hypothetical protein
MDDSGQRLWVTRVCLRNLEDRVTLGVQNGYVGQFVEMMRPTQPRFVRQLVAHVRFSDAGYRVQTNPLFVESDGAFERFCDHLLSEDRCLPLIVFNPSDARAESQPAEEIRYGANLWTLAQWLGGISHVVGLSPFANERLRERFGDGCAMPPGHARLFAPGLGQRFAQDRHPLFSSSAAALGGVPAEEERPDLAHQICRAAYRHSAQQGRLNQFEDLWKQSGL